MRRFKTDMSAIINIGSVHMLPPSAPAVVPMRSSHPSVDRTACEDGTTSRFGRTLVQAIEQSSLSIARARALRAEIQSGVFETPERIDGTIERLLDVIG